MESPQLQNILYVNKPAYGRILKQNATNFVDEMLGSRKEQITKAMEKPATLTDVEYFKDRLDKEDKNTLINTFLYDPIVQSGIQTRVYYVLGRQYSRNIVPKRSDVNVTKNEIDSVLKENIGSDAEIKKLRDYTYLVDEDLCKLPTKLPAYMTVSLLGGRSAGLIERASRKAKLGGIEVPEGTPLLLKPLAFNKLGIVRTDPKTWEITSVEYEDELFKGEGGNIIPKDRLLYLPYNDIYFDDEYYHYGNSILTPIIHISASQRHLNEKVFPEINKSHYAASGLIRFEGFATQDQQKVLELLDAGNLVGFQQGKVEFFPIKLDADMMGLIQQRKDSNTLIMLQTRTPSAFINYEGLTHRSALEIITDVWRETVLENDRMWFRNHMNEQWYMPLLALFLEKKSVFDIKVKIEMEFQNITFADIISKAQAALSLVSNTAYGVPIATLQEVRQMLGLPPQIKAIETTEELSKSFLQDVMAKEQERDATIAVNANRNVDDVPDLNKMDNTQFQNYLKQPQEIVR